MASNSPTVRKIIQKTLNSSGIYFSSDSLTYLTNHLSDCNAKQRQAVIRKIISVIEAMGCQSDSIDLNKLKDILKEAGDNSRRKLRVINFNEWKELNFDANLNKFSEVRRSDLLVRKKFNILQYRMNMIKTLMDPQTSETFNSIESLFERNNVSVHILGMLEINKEGELVVEDSTGFVKVDAKAAIYEPGIYFEGGIFEFFGVLTTGVLRVERITLPHLRPYAFTTLNDGHKKTGDSTNLKKLETDDRIVFLSEVHLDDPLVMSGLHKMLFGFCQCPPGMFVLCGKFLSFEMGVDYMEASKKVFRHLANLLTEFKANYKDTQFVLVPSVQDTLPMDVLPSFALPTSIQSCFSSLKNVHFATNPFQLSFNGLNIVVCRDDLVEKLCAAAIHVPEKIKDLPEYASNTIWSQRHLFPLLFHFKPRFQHVDHVFRLWPAPDVLVIADRMKPFFLAPNERRCLTFNPGSFKLNNFEFQIFSATLQTIETRKAD